MRVLAFADTHGGAQFHRELDRKVKVHKPKAFLCAGDLSFFESGLNRAISKLAAWNIPGFLIHGNHERAVYMAELLEKHKHLKFIHGNIASFGGVGIIGWGGGGFSIVDSQLRRFVDKNKKEIRKHKLVILMTHAPPYGTIADFKTGDHVGNKTITKVIAENKNIVLSLSGHIHECFGAYEKKGHAVIFDPGPLGAIIDITDKHITILE